MSLLLSLLILPYLRIRWGSQCSVFATLRHVPRPSDTAGQTRRSEQLAVLARLLAFGAAAVRKVALAPELLQTHHEHNSCMRVT
jgi:hypothetical protein